MHPLHRRQVSQTVDLGLRSLEGGPRRPVTRSSGAYAVISSRKLALHPPARSEQGMAVWRDLNAPVRSCQGNPAPPRANQHRKLFTNLRATVHRNCANADTESVAYTRRGTLLSIAAATGLLAEQTAGNQAAQALELQQLLPGAGPAPLDQLLSPGFVDINNPGVSWAVGNSGKQLLYPDWMEGTWQFTASFVRVSFPKGQRLVSRDTPGVTKASMVMTLADVGAGMEAPVTYLQRFVASKEEGGIVADRPYNIQEQVNTFLRYPAVQQVDYNPLQNPTRLAVVYKTPRKDTSEISSDLRKAEIFINNRGSGYGKDGAWVGWENYRQVNQARQQGSVGDYLAAWSISHSPESPDTLQIRHRSAAFLQPQDPRFFDAGSAAVAIYDYSMQAQRAR